MSNPVTVLKLQTSCSGVPQEISFGVTTGFKRIPLVSRRINNERSEKQAYAVRTVNITLSGFVTGNNHSEVVALYQQLKSLLSKNDVRITYSSGSTVILNNERIWLDSINEPSDWKQYQGDFEIGLHYIENICYEDDFGISASYIPDVGSSYSFSPVPLWQKSSKPGREAPGSSRFTPSGSRRGNEVTLVLTGDLVAESSILLAQKMDALNDAFKYDGTLNYGAWSEDVRVVSMPQFTSVLPARTVGYSITLVYWDSAIQFQSTRITFSRIHRFPKIKNRLYCGRNEVTEYHTSGQFITYSFKLRAITLADSRTLLANEMATTIYANGVELEGGTEVHEDDDTIVATVKKYHNTPILANL